MLEIDGYFRWSGPELGCTDGAGSSDQSSVLGGRGTEGLENAAKGWKKCDRGGCLGLGVCID